MGDENTVDESYIGVQGEFDSYTCQFEHKGEPVNLGVFADARPAAFMHDLHILLLNLLNFNSQGYIYSSTVKLLNFPELFVMGEFNSKGTMKYRSKLEISQIREVMQHIEVTYMISPNDSVGDEAYIDKIASDTFNNADSGKVHDQLIDKEALINCYQSLYSDVSQNSSSPRTATTDVGSPCAKRPRKFDNKS